MRELRQRFFRRRGEEKREIARAREMGEGVMISDGGSA